MGDQVGEETGSAKFGADRSTGVFRGDMPIFELSFFLQRVGIARYASAVYAMAVSICPSVCLSVTRSYCVQTNEAMIMRFSPSGRTIILLSGEVKIVWKFAGDHP